MQLIIIHPAFILGILALGVGVLAGGAVVIYSLNVILEAHERDTEDSDW